MDLLFELAGDNLKLATDELECVGIVTDIANGVAVAKVSNPDTTLRLAQTHVLMEYLGKCRGTSNDLIELLSQLKICSEYTYACRVRKIYPTIIDSSQLDLERIMGKYIEGKVSLTSPETEYRAIFTDNQCFLGRVIYKINRGSYSNRNPQYKEYFHPGVMMPLMARTLVNLTHVMPNELLCDPFCGTGGLLIEGKIIGARTVGSEYCRDILSGCMKNIPDLAYLLADAKHLPFKNNCFDAIVTDFPYGQSTKIKAPSIDILYEFSLKEIRRILKAGGRAVIVTHRDIRHLAKKIFNINGYYEQRVHKSLTRRILVLN